MGQPIYINADSSNLLASRVRGATDLRSQSFTQFVAGDSIEIDLYLVNSSGLLNIQDYAEIRVGMGNLDSRPDSGDYLIGGSDTLAYNHTASDLKTVIDSQVATATVTMLADIVFKVQFDAVGAQTIPSLDFTDLQPGSTVSVTRLTTGDSVTRESWLWRIFRNPIAFTSVFTNIAGNGVRGTLSLATAGIYDLLAQSDEVNTFFEVELTDTAGNVRTFLQAKVKLKGEVIGHNFSGSIPTSPTNSPEANAFLESFPNPTISGLQFINPGQILNDYQYGSFNPTLSLVSGETTYDQTTYATRLGYYVKIGKVVIVNFRIKITDPDSLMINAPQTSSFAISNMPYPALNSGISPDISIRPRRGWQNLGDKSYSGVIYNNYMYFYKNQTQIGGAGVGWNLSNLTPSDFSVNPFNFVESSGGAFSFFGSGSYVTEDDI